MASAPLPLSILIVVSLLSLSSGGSMNLDGGMGMWCVAKPSANDTILQSNIDFACSHVDCSSLREGGPCFQPDTLISHASVAMNLYYEANGKTYLNCLFRDSSLITVTDPSFDNCKYS